MASSRAAAVLRSSSGTCRLSVGLRSFWDSSPACRVICRRSWVALRWVLARFACASARAVLALEASQSLVGRPLVRWVGQVQVIRLHGSAVAPRVVLPRAEKLPWMSMFARPIVRSNMVNSASVP